MKRGIQIKLELSNNQECVSRLRQLRHRDAELEVDEVDEVRELEVLRMHLCVKAEGNSRPDMWDHHMSWRSRLRDAVLWYTVATRIGGARPRANTQCGSICSSDAVQENLTPHRNRAGRRKPKVARAHLLCATRMSHHLACCAEDQRARVLSAQDPRGAATQLTPLTVPDYRPRVAQIKSPLETRLPSRRSMSPRRLLGPSRSPVWCPCTHCYRLPPRD